MRKYFCCSIVGYSKLTMEDGKTLEVSVKTEIVDPENGEKPNEPQQCDDLLGKCNLTEEEVWIKPDANENSQDAEKVDAHTTVEVEIVEEELSENKDDQAEDSKLPLKKRKQSSDNTGKPMSDEELIKEEKMEQDAPEENNESNEQAEKTEDDKPKATYSRKRVSLTQLELLVEFLEAHRDLARNRLKSREGNALSTRLWTECAAILNAEGDQRTPKQWNKVCSIFKRGPDRKDWYTDFKSRLLSRVRQIRHNSQGNGGPSSLSPLEDRIATLLCKDREVVGRSGTPQMEEQSGIGQINPLATRSISLATFDNIEEAAEPIEIIYEDTVDVQGESLEVAGASTASNHTESEQEATAPCETTAVSQCTAVTAPSQTAAHRQRYSRRRPRRSNRRSSAHYSLERSRDQLLNMEASRIEVERLMAAAYSRMADATYKMADAAAKSAQAQCHIADALENISRSLQNRNKYIMYSYEITKNIQIVTITEEERQVEHMESMNSRRHMRHVCEDCAVGFVLEQAYLMHMKVHSKEAGDHECELCHSHLKTADMLYRHRLRHYRRYRCLLCWTRFKDKDTAACHVMTDHVGTAFECEHCGRGFKRPQYLKRHVEQYHTKPHRLECAVCFRVFHERGWYRSHIRTHNEEVRAGTVKVPVSCDICARVFKNKSCLKRHMLSHEAENVACDICSLVFKNRHMLGQHYLNVHHEKYEGAPDLTCEICLRVCATRAMLKRHMRRMHSDRTKKYQCDHCQRYYLTKGEVRSHISWSHAAGSARGGHACGCGRVFRTPSLLRDHTARFHALEPPPRNHECEHCGKAFSNKQVLNRHKKSHSNEMYPCNECGLLFKTQPYVKVHYQIKHLNMTRAQISAQRKLNKTNRIPQNNIHVKPTWEEPPIPNKKNNIVSENDPLLVQETDIQIKVEREEDDEDVHVPLFQTFVDVNRN